VKDIVESDLNDLKAAILQDNTLLKTLPGEFVEPEVINKVLIPKVIQTKYPELTPEEVEEVRQHVVADSAIKNGEIKTVGDALLINPGECGGWSTGEPTVALLDIKTMEARIVAIQ